MSRCPFGTLPIYFVSVTCGFAKKKCRCQQKPTIDPTVPLMKTIIADRFLDVLKHWRTWREDIASPIIDLDDHWFDRIELAARATVVGVCDGRWRRPITAGPILGVCRSVFRADWRFFSKMFSHSSQQEAFKDVGGAELLALPTFSNLVLKVLKNVVTTTQTGASFGNRPRVLLFCPGDGLHRHHV